MCGECGWSHPFNERSSRINQTSFQQVYPLSNFLIIIFFQQFQMNHSYSKPVIVCCCSGKKRCNYLRQCVSKYVGHHSGAWVERAMQLFLFTTQAQIVGYIFDSWLIIIRCLKTKSFRAVNQNIIVMNSPVSVYKTATSHSVMHRL